MEDQNALVGVQRANAQNIKLMSPEFDMFRNTKLNSSTGHRVPEAKDSRTIFGSKFWPRPGCEPKNRLVAPKGRYTEIYAQSLEGTCGPFVRVGVHVQALGGGCLSSSLSL